MGLGLYVHIPFCISKCHYCDFLSFPGEEETIAAYCAALNEEIRRTGQRLGRPAVSTVFVGGGTPSVLPLEQTASLFQCIRDHFCLDEGAEVSLEANPGTLTGEKLSLYHDLGINRLSMGLQSTDDGLLKTLGRIHTLDRFLQNYDQARAAGFTNINIDIMSGLPGQSLFKYLDTLHTVAALKPEHISSYSLILEEGTPFFNSEEIRRLLPDEETERTMYEKTKEVLAENGYVRYEISNYARPGYACRHNLGYWDGAFYLGLGLGASSYYSYTRFSNEKNLKNYLSDPCPPFSRRDEYQVCDKKDRMENYMIFGLRKTDGVSVSRFEREFTVTMDAVYGDVLSRFCDMGFLTLSGDTLRLTDAGIDVSNRIFEEFLIF